MFLKSDEVNTSWGFFPFWSWNWFLQRTKIYLISSNSRCFIYSALCSIVLRGIYCTYIGSRCWKAKRGWFRVLNQQCPPPIFDSILLIKSWTDWTRASVSYCHLVFLTPAQHPHQAAASSHVRSLFMKWRGELNAKQLQLPKHEAGGCLFCCYHGDIPLNSPLCKKVLKFIYLRIKGQRARTPERETEEIQCYQNCNQRFIQTTLMD